MSLSLCLSVSLSLSLSLRPLVYPSLLLENFLFCALCLVTFPGNLSKAGNPIPTLPGLVNRESYVFKSQPFFISGCFFFF
jgi:hypothetical protein